MHVVEAVNRTYAEQGRQPPPFGNFHEMGPGAIIGMQPPCRSPRGG